MRLLLGPSKRYFLIPMRGSEIQFRRSKAFAPAFLIPMRGSEKLHVLQADKRGIEEFLIPMRGSEIVRLGKQDGKFHISDPHEG